ncbi:MAG: anhydro-N-acetylmuramic acid kinase [Bacteroidetes bacterium]|nr:MAG: anhydro-N-acetylmuramic acid kinase [Bacteroidota bacterium]
MFKKKYNALGLMSGSSLDGLDIAYCTFKYSEWGGELKIKDWEIVVAETIPYPEEWLKRLKEAPTLSGLELTKLNADLGRYFGVQTLIFLGKHDLQPDFIASHGHTVFHYPDQTFTLQVGDGAAMAAITGYPVIDDFRAQDVALSGQGAPLAPLADKYLFDDYDMWLNLGGIANVTVRTGEDYVAFDVGGANQVLNDIVSVLGWPYDDGGRFAAVGQLQEDLLTEVNQLKFFQEPYPKSLGNNWVRDVLIPIYQKYDCSVEDKLHTATIQLADQLAGDLKAILGEKLVSEEFKMLVTGGGALNDFQIKCIQKSCDEIGKIMVEVPDEKTIEYKEAALMALLGVLRLENVATSMPSVTGAKEASIGGAFHQGWRFVLD